MKTAVRGNGEDTDCPARRFRERIRKAENEIS